MVEWRAQCGSTIRLNSQVLNRGTPSMENELWNVNAQVLNGKMTPGTPPPASRPASPVAQPQQK